MSSWATTSNAIVERLREDVQAGVVIPFIGSGASYSSNLPSWRVLARGVAERLGFDIDVFESQGSFPQLFDFYIATSEPQELEKFAAELNKAFARATATFVPSALHGELVAMDSPVVYTTNYDDLIERSFKELGRAAVPVITYSDLASRVPADVVQIIKYHGDFAVPNTLVLTEHQYFQRMTLDTAIDVRLRSDALSRSLLFVGYSLSDMNVRYLLYRLSEERLANSSGRTPGKNERRSYLVSSSVGEVQKEILRSRYNVHCIELLPGYSEQDQRVADLLEYCRKP